MDIVMLTGLFPKEKREEIIQNSIGVIQNAADALQWNLIDGLDANLEKPVKVSILFMLVPIPNGIKKQLFIQSRFSIHQERTILMSDF